MTYIFVIDDHQVTIDGIRAILDPKVDKITIVGTANSAGEALPKLFTSRANVILLDLLMPDLSGVEFCRVLKRKYPEKKVIAFTGDLNPVVLYNTWMNRADAILMKTCTKEELVDTIHTVLAGFRIMGDGVPNFYKAVQGDKIKERKLTPGEKQVLRLFIQGSSRAEVADLLTSSYNAVNHHTKNLFKKFKTNNLVSLVAMAKEEGFGE